MHAQWKLLLDDEFMEAYQHGVKITCHDGLDRRFYPRLFTYSADYPEKCGILLIQSAYSKTIILGFLWLAFGTWASVHVLAAWFLCRMFTILEQDETGWREFRSCVWMTTSGEVR